MILLSTGKLLAASVLIAAAAWDLRTRRIPNRLCLAAALTGVLYCGWTQGGWGVLFWAARTAAVLALTMPFYLTRALGAGDCKLAAVLSSYFTRQELLVLFGSALLLGAMLGLAALPQRIAGCLRKKGISHDRKQTTVPFACCLAAGAVTLEAAKRTGMFDGIVGLLSV